MKKADISAPMFSYNAPPAYSKFAKGVLAGALVTGAAFGHVDNTAHEAVFGTSITAPEITANPLSWIDTPLHDAVDAVEDVVVPAIDNAVVKFLGGEPLFSLDS